MLKRHADCRPGATNAASAPASTSGTSTNDTIGMATRLTASPTSDTPPNTAKVSGASASMMAHCRRTAPTHVRGAGTSDARWTP